jgi:hypothetical protein
VQGPAGVQGQTGQAGPVGTTGITGSQGPQGINSTETGSTLAAFFSGVIWNPDVGTDDLAVLAGNKTLDFGEVTADLDTGSYIAVLTLQVGFNDGGAGANDQNGVITFYDGTTARQAIKFSRGKTGTTGFGYSASVGYTHQFQVTVTQGDNLYLKADDNAFILGAQLALYSLPPVVISSPGFI